MFCGKCGSKMEDNAIFCPKCGAKVENSSIEPGYSEINVSDIREKKRESITTGRDAILSDKSIVVSIISVTIAVICLIALLFVMIVSDSNDGKLYDGKNNTKTENSRIATNGKGNLKETDVELPSITPTYTPSPINTPTPTNTPTPSPSPTPTLTPTPTPVPDWELGEVCMGTTGYDYTHHSRIGYGTKVLYANIQIINGPQDEKLDIYVEWNCTPAGEASQFYTTTMTGIGFGGKTYLSMYWTDYITGEKYPFPRGNYSITIYDQKTWRVIGWAQTIIG